MKRAFSYLFLIPLFALMSLAAGCGSAVPGEAHEITLAPLHTMPMDVQSAPVTVQEAYQFAVANPDTLSELPCYCGCGAMGHDSNLACYVKAFGADGAPVFDSHALGCSICVDITQDAMRLLRQGKSVADIKDYVDTAYAKYGPSNMP
jgi:hypothetical protein